MGTLRFTHLHRNFGASKLALDLSYIFDLSCQTRLNPLLFGNKNYHRTLPNSALFYMGSIDFGVSVSDISSANGPIVINNLGELGPNLNSASDFASFCDNSC